MLFGFFDKNLWICRQNCYGFVDEMFWPKGVPKGPKEVRRTQRWSEGPKEGPKGLRLEVGPRRGPRLLFGNIRNIHNSHNIQQYSAIFAIFTIFTIFATFAIFTIFAIFCNIHNIRNIGNIRQYSQNFYLRQKSPKSPIPSLPLNWILLKSINKVSFYTIKLLNKGLFENHNNFNIIFGI